MTEEHGGCLWIWFGWWWYATSRINQGSLKGSWIMLTNGVERIVSKAWIKSGPAYTPVLKAFWRLPWMIGCWKWYLKTMTMTLQHKGNNNPCEKEDRNSAVVSLSYREKKHESEEDPWKSSEMFQIGAELAYSIIMLGAIWRNEVYPCHKLLS